jgi:predicted ATP-dependent Lon-type protease
MMEEKEIKKKLIEYFKKMLKEKDLKKRRKIASQVRKFCEGVIKEYYYGCGDERKERFSLKELKSEVLHENFELFLTFDAQDVGDNSLSRWIFMLEND